MTTYSFPAPFPGTPAEVQANQDSHVFFYNGTEDDMDCRCGHCDCRPGSVSSQWPCGATVPRIVEVR